MTEGRPSDGARDAAVGRGAVVATLIWRGEKTTRACLESLRALPGWPVDVLVVHDASGAGQSDRLAAAYGIATNTTDHNGGMASAYNAAIAWALERGFSHALPLNNDVRVPDPCELECLLPAAGPRVAAVGPVVRDEDEGISSAGRRLGRWTGRSWHRREIVADVRHEADWFDGCAMLVSVAAAREIGGLAEDFFPYWEETDWCARARRAGWGVRLQPAADVVHVRGGTAATSQTYGWSIRNVLLHGRRHAAVPDLLTSRPHERPTVSALPTHVVGDWPHQRYRLPWVAAYRASRTAVPDQEPSANWDGRFETQHPSSACGTR